MACLLLILFFQTSPAFAGLTLCIGESGHVEIESEDAGCCPSTAQSETGSAYVQSSEKACGSCIDVCLGSEETAAWAKTEAPGFQGLPLAASVLERLNPLPSPPAVPDQGLPKGSSLAAIRSIVLRI